MSDAQLFLEIERGLRNEAPPPLVRIRHDSVVYLLFRDVSALELRNSEPPNVVRVSSAAAAYAAGRVQGHFEFSEGSVESFMYRAGQNSY